MSRTIITSGADELELYTKCSCNEGVEWYDGKATCTDCDGKSAHLTIAGQNLITFLESIGIVIPKPNGWIDLL